MAVSNFSKKADQRYRTFSKKSGCASELFKKNVDRGTGLFLIADNDYPLF